MSMEALIRKFGLITEDRPENVYIKKVTPEEVDAFIAQETPLSRVKTAFWKDKYGRMGPEFNNLMDSGMHVGFITFFVVNYFTGTHAHYRWHATNQITVFETRYKAVRAYMDYVFLKSMQQSAIWAVKFATFGMLFLGGTKAVGIANNKTRLTDYTVGGLLAGSVMRFSMGIRGTAVGALVGTVLGTMAGCIVYPIQKYGKLTEEHRHQAVIAYHLAQQKYYESLIGSGKKIPTAREERQQRRQERMTWLKGKIIGKKEGEPEGSTTTDTVAPTK